MFSVSPCSAMSRWTVLSSIFSSLTTSEGEVGKCAFMRCCKHFQSASSFSKLNAWELFYCSKVKGLFLTRINKRHNWHSSFQLLQLDLHFQWVHVQPWISCWELCLISFSMPLTKPKDIAYLYFKKHTSLLFIRI